jgi:RNA polymerase sigma factor (sigma-70 family)
MIWRERRTTSQQEIHAEEELELRLSAQARAGVAWALSALVARYQPSLVRYLVRLTGNQQTGYALAEQVFVRMGRRLRGPQGGRHLRLWLLRAATDAGLDALRAPAAKRRNRLLGPVGTAGLLPAVIEEPRASRILTSLGVKQQRRDGQHDPLPTQEFVWQADATEDTDGVQQARLAGPLSAEQVRMRLIRAVLAELPYADAQCLALHLVAGLNQSDVAQALGLQDVVVRRRVVQGLAFFGARYEATLDRLGLHDDEGLTAAESVTPGEVLTEMPFAAVVEAPQVVAAASDSNGQPEAPTYVEISTLAELAAEAPALTAGEHESRRDVDGAEALASPSFVNVGSRAEPELELVATVLDAAQREDAMTLAEVLAAIRAGEAAAPEREVALDHIEQGGGASEAATPTGTEGDDDQVTARRPAVTWKIIDVDDRDTRQVDPVTEDADDEQMGRALMADVHGVARSPDSAGLLDGLEQPASPELAAFAPAVGTGQPDDTATAEMSQQPVIAVSAAPVTRPLALLAAPVTHPLGTIAPLVSAAVGADALVPAGPSPNDESTGLVQPEGFADALPMATTHAPARRLERLVRTRRVLSADGEAEDPGDEALWPLG